MKEGIYYKPCAGYDDYKCDEIVVTTNYNLKRCTFCKKENIKRRVKRYYQRNRLKVIDRAIARYWGEL